MTGSVLDISNQILALSQRLKNRLYNFQIALFIVTADIVYLADFALTDNQVNRAAVIRYVQPVSHICAFAVNRNAFISQRS